MTQLTGKMCVVTGGRQGIGLGIVSQFITEGATVITCGRGSVPDTLPPGCRWHQVNVAQTDAVTDFADLLGNIDVLVNNAGVQIEKNCVDSSDADWDLVMGVNAKGVFNMCRAFIPRMRPGGSIINIGSISGNAADPEMALYNASKAFVHGLTRSIAVDHGPDLRCNAICPGWIETGMLEAAFELAEDPKAARADALRRHSAGRFGKPADIASLAVWLAADASTFATGQCYVVDGGMTAASPIQPGLH